MYLGGGKADVPQLQNGSQDSPGGGQLVVREADSLQSLHQVQKVLPVLLPQDVTRSALGQQGQIIMVSCFRPRLELSYQQQREVVVLRTGEI